MRTDLRDVLRSLTRDRAFTALAILLLALTTGATIAVFAVVQAVLLAPLPFADTDRTVVIWEYDTARSTPVVEVGLGEVEGWLGPGSPLESVAVFTSVNVPVVIQRGGARSRANANAVSTRFFDVVGTLPVLGRSLDASDQAADVPRAAVISDGYWRREFGADPAIVGTTLRLQDDADAPPRLVEIVGVMPAGFDFPREADLWIPAAPLLRSFASAAPPAERDAVLEWNLTYFKIFYALGRLRPEVSPEGAAIALGHIVRARELPSGRPSGVIVTPVQDYIVGPTRPVLLTMLAGALLMVVLACSSVAGLHVFRAARQDRALAIQLALGAGRSRLMRLALVECGLLAVAAVVHALAIAWALSRLLVALAPADVPRLSSSTVFTLSTVLAAAGLALGATVLSGVWPALFVSRVDPSRVLTSGARTAMHPRERLLQRLGVGWQMAVAIVILTGAALFVRSVQALERTPLGFEPQDLLAIEVRPSAAELTRWDQFFEALLARAAGLPAIDGIGAIARRPLSGPVGNDSIPVLKGQEGLGPDAPWRQNPRANLQTVMPGYFRTVGPRLLEGRDFTYADVAEALNVVIVGASAAARLWPGRSPIGELMLVPTQRQPGELESPRWQTVVGVVEDVRYRGITDPRLDVYMPAMQSTIRVGHVLVRSSAPASTAVAGIQSIARALDPGVLTGEIVTMADVVARDTAPWRFAMRVLTAFGALAAGLAVLGLVGLLSLAVTLRRRELGIRAALGATPGRLRAHVLAEAVWIGGLAAVVGTMAAMGLGRWVAGLVVGTSPRDPLSVFTAVTVTMVLALAGCLWPAHRAGAIDPIEALRE